MNSTVKAAKPTNVSRVVDEIKQKASVVCHKQKIDKKCGIFSSRLICFYYIL